MSDAARQEQISVLMLAIGALHKARGGQPLCRVPGLHHMVIDDQWQLWLNGHREPLPLPHLPGTPVAPFNCYVEFNGFPAGSFSSFGGLLAAGEAANEETLLAALRRATRLAESSAVEGVSAEEMGAALGTLLPLPQHYNEPCTTLPVAEEKVPDGLHDSLCLPSPVPAVIEAVANTLKARHGIPTARLWDAVWYCVPRSIYSNLPTVRVECPACQQLVLLFAFDYRSYLQDAPGHGNRWRLYVGPCECGAVAWSKTLLTGGDNGQDMAPA